MNRRGQRRIRCLSDQIGRVGLTAIASWLAASASCRGDSGWCRECRAAKDRAGCQKSHCEIACMAFSFGKAPGVETNRFEKDDPYHIRASPLTAQGWLWDVSATLARGAAPAQARVATSGALGRRSTRRQCGSLVPSLLTASRSACAKGERDAASAAERAMIRHVRSLHAPRNLATACETLSRAGYSRQCRGSNSK